MKRLAELCILAALGGSMIMGQEDAVPARWIGAWSLSPRESQLGEFWAPGGPSGLTAMSQALEIAATSERIKITTHIFTSWPPRESSREEFEFNLDGRETVSPAGASLSFRRIDDRTFDIVVSGNNKKLGSCLVEKHFVFSGGTKLAVTETRRWLDAKGGDQTKGAVVRTSNSVLVFDSVPSMPHVRRLRYFWNLE